MNSIVVNDMYFTIHVLYYTSLYDDSVGVYKSKYIYNIFQQIVISLLKVNHL